jgi:sulfur-carrier protein
VKGVVRVELPYHLRQLAGAGREVQLQLDEPVTQRSLLDALEDRYPPLRGTIRDQATQLRRPYVRFYACHRDLSHEAPDAPLPAEVVRGDEPFLVIGALSGG